MSDLMKQWARIGAVMRLRQLDAEEAEIWKAFPDLRTKNTTRGEAMKRAWATRRAKNAKPS